MGYFFDPLYMKFDISHNENYVEFNFSLYKKICNKMVKSEKHRGKKYKGFIQKITWHDSNTQSNFKCLKNYEFHVFDEEKMNKMLVDNKVFLQIEKKNNYPSMNTCYSPFIFKHCILSIFTGKRYFIRPLTNITTIYILIYENCNVYLANGEKVNENELKKYGFNEEEE
jgi:hypothetical protein